MAVRNKSTDRSVPLLLLTLVGGGDIINNNLSNAATFNDLNAITGDDFFTILKFVRTFVVLSKTLIWLIINCLL